MERLRRLLKKIIQKLHPIAWLRAKIGHPGGTENQREGDVEMGNLGDEKKEAEIIAKMEKLIDAAIDIGSESLLKALAEKLNP